MRRLLLMTMLLLGVLRMQAQEQRPVVALQTDSGTIKIALKYDAVDKVNAIKCLKRVSRPGLRQYAGYKDMPRVLNGLGIAIISTSKGVMTNKQAKAEKVGGEVLCYVY